MQRLNGGSRAAATRRASKIDTGSCGMLQPGLPPSRSCIATSAPATTLVAVKTAIRRDKKLPKEELIQFEGLVIEILPDARYRVQLDAGYEVVAYTAGKMKKNRIRTLAGDRVTIEMSPYDLSKGRLVFRHKDERSGTGPRAPLRNRFRRR